MTLSLVAAMVAADRNEGIARGGDLPWNIPSDLKRMKQVTTGDGNNAVLMGRTTFLTLPRALPNRRNLVLTRDAGAVFAGARTVTSWEEALEVADRAGIEALWVLGGAEVYRLVTTTPELTRIELTRVNADFDCDVRWPGVPEAFTLSEASAPLVENGISFRFERWDRPA